MPLSARKLIHLIPYVNTAFADHVEYHLCAFQRVGTAVGLIFEETVNYYIIE